MEGEESVDKREEEVRTSNKLTELNEELKQLNESDEPFPLKPSDSDTPQIHESPETSKSIQIYSLS
jgi:hypothetical protein